MSTDTPTPTRDHSETPDDVAQRIAGDRKSGADDNNATAPTARDALVDYALGGVHDIKLTRLGHYHPGRGVDGRCFAALVTGVRADADEIEFVSLSIWPSGLYDAVTDSGVGPGLRAQLTVPVGDPSDSPAGSFHLSRECPWGR